MQPFWRGWTNYIGALAGSLLATGVQAQQVTLKPAAEGVLKRVRGLRAQQMMLSAEPPPGQLKIRADVNAPLFGTLTLGPKESPSVFIVLVDEPAGKDARLFVDANGNGDFTDDTPCTWNRKNYTGSDGKTYAHYTGAGTFQVRYGEETVPLGLRMERFDRADPARATIKDALFYQPNYARVGELKAGEKIYPIVLTEATATGDLRFRPGVPGSNVLLLIDRNGNGVYDIRGEVYDASQPFTLDSVTYEIADLVASGKSFTLQKSAKKVPEVPAPPDLRPGKKVVPFEAKTMTGQKVRFPGDFKGKPVLLYFWASWCGDCKAELPFVTRAYQTYHPKGLEVLGVSLDRENIAPQLADFLKKNNMPWPQIYEGKFWQVSLAQTYLISWIPTALLVDGDTGEILATGDDLMNEKLATTIEKFLSRKSSSSQAR